MKKRSYYLTTAVLLFSTLIFNACTPTQNQTPVSSSSPTVSESEKPVASASPTASPSVLPSNVASVASSIVPSIMPSTVASSVTTPIPVISASASVEKTYKYDFSLNSGKATAYVTYKTPTSGSLLVNFENVDTVPTKLALLDSFGNEIALAKTFNISKMGYVILDFMLKNGEAIYKIKITINGIDYVVDAKITNDIPTFTSVPSPVSPNPTASATTSSYTPTNYPQTYIPTVGFAGVKYIVNQKCNTCHNPGFSDQDIMNSAWEINDLTRNRIMPPEGRAPLSEAEIKTIQDWYNSLESA